MNAYWLFLVASFTQQTNATSDASNVVPAPIWLQVIVWAFIIVGVAATIAMLVSIIKDMFR